MVAGSEASGLEDPKEDPKNHLVGAIELSSASLFICTSLQLEGADPGS